MLGSLDGLRVAEGPGILETGAMAVDSGARTFA